MYFFNTPSVHDLDVRLFVCIHLSLSTVSPIDIAVFMKILKIDFLAFLKKRIYFTYDLCSFGCLKPSLLFFVLFPILSMLFHVLYRRVIFCVISRVLSRIISHAISVCDFNVLFCHFIVLFHVLFRCAICACSLLKKHKRNNRDRK